jgi:hypothetical protein
MAAEFEVPIEEIEKDVEGFATELLNRKILVAASAAWVLSQALKGMAASGVSDSTRTCPADARGAQGSSPP